MTLLSKTQCSALRGIAIMGIMLHNFLHWLGPMVKENEYQYIQRNVDWLCRILASPDEHFLFQLISFFGHYGVPVFLFLSGYGLVLKYERKDAKEEGPYAFLWKHYMKLFPMMLLGFCLFAMVDWVTPGHHHWTWVDILAQLTMTSNFFPNPDKVIWPGPYWFFSLMMQLYIIYRLVLYRRSWCLTVGAIVVCWAIQALCFDAPGGDAINYIRYSSIGGMLPFGMGILLARASICNPQFSIFNFQFSILNSLGVFLFSLLAILSMSLNFHSWLWVPAFVVIGHVAFIKMWPERWLAPLNWLGVLSSAIFVCHPITRKIFIPISRHGDILDGLVLYIVTSILLAMLFQKIMAKK